MIPTRIAVAIVAVFAGLSGCTSWTAPDDGDAMPSDTGPPKLSPGIWWRYEGSDGRTYTHRYDGLDKVAGVETYRIQVDLSQPDDNGQDHYTFWYATGNFGFMAYRAGPFYAETDCPKGAWFPLDQTIEDDCDTTLYNNGAVVARYDDRTTKTPHGWEHVVTGAGTFHAYRMEFYDHSTNETANTWWYAPEISYRVKMIGTDGTTSTLAAWGKTAPPTPA